MQPCDWRSRSSQFIGSSEFGEFGGKRRIGGGQIGGGDGDGDGDGNDGVDDGDNGTREGKGVE